MTDQQTVAIVGPNYLYMNELEIPPGRTPNECIAEGKEWIKAIRETGDFKSARLYIHNTGPMFALYVLVEPKSWASMENGFEKALMGMGLMDKPWNWGRHTDNLLSEIPVD